jgi:predicted small lipoprotein YifL
MRNWMIGLLLLVPLAGCDLDGLLEVPDPDVVSVPVFEDPENLPAVRAGVVREFARAYAGTQNGEGGQILFSGLLTDELFHSGTFTTRQEVDQRRIMETNSSNQTAFFWLQRARNHAETAAGLYVGSEEAGSEGHAEVVGLAGFSYVLFAENYCSGVPFSVLPIEGETVFGDPESTEEILDRAIARFDEALDLAPDGTGVDLMARIGKARALLSLGRTDEAAQMVANVPTTFEYVVAYSSAVRAANNAVWNLINAEKRWSAADSEGTNGLPFRSVEDPRTPTSPNGPGFDGNVQAFAQLKYPEPGSDVVLASGIEARLIEAEAALQTDRGRFFDLHNSLRGMIGLDAVEDAGQSTAELVELHFAERAYWLWLTSHRLGDLRRMIRQYGMTADQVYPVGMTVRGRDRGDMVTLLVPFTEQENPSYDPTACDPTRP